MSAIEIKVPDIGDFAEVTVIELMVKPGDTVTVDQSLMTVESDKASMEIPSSHAGVVKEFKVSLGDKVKEGSIVLVLETAGADVAPAAAPAPASEQKEAPAQAAPAPAAAVSVAPTAPTAPAATSAIEVRVPDIGDFKDVSVIEVMVNVGDTIRLEQSLITVESDKAAMEIPSSSAGVLKELKVKMGDKVNIGDLLAILEGSAPVAAAPAAPAAATPASAPAPAPASLTAAPAAVWRQSNYRQQWRDRAQGSLTGEHMDLSPIEINAHRSGGVVVSRLPEVNNGRFVQLLGAIASDAIQVGGNSLPVTDRGVWLELGKGAHVVKLNG